MLLKEPSTGVLVHSIGVEVVEVPDTLLQSRVLQALVDGVAEELYVGIQGELVHGVDATHVVHHEEQEGGSLSTRPVTLGKTHTHKWNLNYLH